MKTYNLMIKVEFLKMILDGRKTIDVQLAYPHFATMAAGDTVCFNGEYRYTVAKVARYPDFDALVASEHPEPIHPSDPGNVLAVLHASFPPEKAALGCLAIHLRPRGEHPYGSVDPAEKGT